jgi:hypothetical protein
MHPNKLFWIFPTTNSSVTTADNQSYLDMSPTEVKIVAHALKKFDGTNFLLLYSTRWKCISLRKKLWPYVDPDTSLSGIGSVGMQKWAWSVGGVAYLSQTQTTANKLILKRQFRSFTYTSIIIDEHLLTFQKLTVDMAASGCQPTEDDRMARLMESLPSEYDALIASINVST